MKIYILRAYYGEYDYAGEDNIRAYVDVKEVEPIKRIIENHERLKRDIEETFPNEADYRGLVFELTKVTCKNLGITTKNHYHTFAIQELDA